MLFLYLSLLFWASLTSWTKYFKFSPDKQWQVAASSEVDVCTRVGLDLGDQGGNAADMAVGMAFCLGVVGMYHSGIGGGGFALIRTPTGDSEVVDFREEAPAQAHRHLFDGRPDARVVTGLAVGVPGELRGLEAIHIRHGQLPWKVAVEPAVRLARRGFEVSADLVRFMEGAIEGRDDFFLTEPWAEDFAPNGTRVAVGSTMTRRRYADTLETIATLGVDAFYTGPMAHQLARSVRQDGGILTADDLAQYRVVIREPVEVSYRDFILRSCPSPAGGPVTLSILKTLEGFDSPAHAGINVSSHRLNEAFRFGFGARTQLGDPGFTPEVRQREQDILTDTYAAHVRSNIWDSSTRPLDVYNPSLQQIITPAGTTHLVAADKSGRTVSLTTTLNRYFGSHVMDSQTGVIFNCQMQDFALPSAPEGLSAPPANEIHPGQRPLSSASPLTVEHANGTVLLSMGAAGGPKIITTIVQILLHVLDDQATLINALAAARMHDSLTPNETVLELPGRGTQGFSNGTAEFLRMVGHRISYVAPTKSAAHLVGWGAGGRLMAAADPRHAGAGAGVRGS